MEKAIRCSEEYFPRVLIVTPNAFETLSGGGITLTNLFHGWPVDRIAQIHSSVVAPDRSVCRRFYKLREGPAGELSLIPPLSLIHHFSGRRTADAGTSSGEPLVNGPDRAAGFAPEESLARKAVRQVWMHTAGEEPPVLGRVSNALRRWVRDFQPEILYCHLGYLPYIQIPLRLSAEFNIPIAIHMMDDWPMTIYRRGGIFGPFMRVWVKRALEKVLDLSVLHLGICESMCQAYEKRYGTRFLAFHNTLNIEEWLPYARRNWTPGRRFRIVYSGSIENKQVKGLCDVCDAVAALYASGMDVEMRIHTPWFYAERHAAVLERDVCVKVCGPTDQASVASLFGEADLLVVAVNFDCESETYFRYSMPTKVPAYMISGTPILLYGPRSIASVQYAEQEKWGYVVSEQGVSALVDAIRLLATDIGLRTRLGRRAQALARENHDAASVRKAFQRALTNVVADCA